MEERPKISIVYQWRYRDPVRKRWATSHHMTDEDAEAWKLDPDHTQATRLDHTREEREACFEFYRLPPSMEKIVKGS